MKLVFLGAVHEVAGSCTLLEVVANKEPAKFTDQITALCEKYKK